MGNCPEHDTLNGPVYATPAPCRACADRRLAAAEARAERAEATVAKLAAEVSRLREALENAADDGHGERCVTMLLYRGCTCHQQETLKALGWACPACDGEGAVLSGDRARMRCGACDATGRAALAAGKGGA